MIQDDCGVCIGRIFEERKTSFEVLNYSRYVEGIVLIAGTESTANPDCIISIHCGVEYITDGIVKGSERHTNKYIEEYM